MFVKKIHLLLGSSNIWNLGHSSIFQTKVYREMAWRKVRAPSWNSYVPSQGHTFPHVKNCNLALHVTQWLPVLSKIYADILERCLQGKSCEVSKICMLLLEKLACELSTSTRGLFLTHHPSMNRQDPKDQKMEYKKGNNHKRTKV